MKKISITINGKLFFVDSGKTLLDVALENGIDIPFLCHHPDIEPQNKCGMCLVEIKGSENLKYACSEKVEDGMEVIIDSQAVKEERKKNLEAILKRHVLECDDCVWLQKCKLLELVKKNGAKPSGQKNEDWKVLQSGVVVFDQTKCIGCGNCTKVCPTGFLEMDAQGKIRLTEDKTIECINCGQCIIHCPVGAIEGQGEFEELEKLFQDKSKVMVVQFAPAIRTSIGEEFGMDMGTDATGQLVSGLKQLGFGHVFDTATGADFTTMEESDEIIERLLSKKHLPALTSCCPAWVRFVEFNYPEFIPNICTSRSPQIMLGGIIKNYWSRKNNIDPKNIFVVSIMPCVSKKFEVKREELKIDGQYPVDCVLTTRELARLLKKNNIDLKNIVSKEADDPFGRPSGAGVIYGTSGGVFESALRTAYFKMTGDDLPQDAVKEIRGLDGIKTKEVRIGDRLVRLCVASGIRNARKILDEVKADSGKYDAIEIMACPGGCIGGGGQPLPTNKEIAKKRSAGLYAIDQDKELKCAHHNMAVKAIYGEFFTDEEMRKKILHTHFAKREKLEVKTLKNSKETYG